jgi:hypothetical protein
MEAHNEYAFPLKITAELKRFAGFEMNVSRRVELTGSDVFIADIAGKAVEVMVSEGSLFLARLLLLTHDCRIHSLCVRLCTESRPVFPEDDLLIILRKGGARASPTFLRSAGPVGARLGAADKAPAAA